MSEKKLYSIEYLPEIKLNEHIRLRPAMYLGRVNLNGFIGLLKGIFQGASSELETNQVSFDFRNKNSGKIRIEHISKPVNDSWSKWNNSTGPFNLEFIVLNTLCSIFKIKLLDANKNIKLKQVFEKGELTRGKTYNQPITCDQIEITFTLDTNIWGHHFNWLESYINYEIREFAFLNKNIKFKLSYPIDNEECSVIYCFKNGLQDKIEVENLKGIGDTYLNTYSHTKLKNIDLELAFAFRHYMVDEPILKSYVNDHYTPENGSHVKGLLKGLNLGITSYFHKHDLVKTHKVTKKRILKNLVAIIHLRYNEATFSGSVKNELANPEIIQPIADHVAALVLKKIETDKTVADQLISTFI